MKHYKEKHCKKLEHKLWEEDLVLQMCHGELTKFQSLRKSSSRRAMATSTALTIVKPPNLTTTSCTRLLVLMVESKMQEVLASSPSSRMTQPSRKTRRSSLRAESPDTESVYNANTAKFFAANDQKKIDVGDKFVALQNEITPGKEEFAKSAAAFAGEAYVPPKVNISPTKPAVNTQTGTYK